MSIEENIKSETDIRFNQIKEAMKDKGVTLGPSEELYFKMGVSYGISIAGLALVNINAGDLLLK